MKAGCIAIIFWYTTAALAGESQEKLSVLLAVSGLGLLLRNDEIKDVFETYFHEVDLPQNLSDSVLKIHVNEHRIYSYLQSKDEFKSVPVPWVSKDFYEKLSPHVSFYPRKTGEYFNINLPLETNSGKKIVMNECLAIFMLMFYTSELVRYNPRIIQENLSKPQGWLMERFVVNTPQTFLRYMVNNITGEDFIFAI